MPDTPPPEVPAIYDDEGKPVLPVRHTTTEDDYVLFLGKKWRKGQKGVGQDLKVFVSSFRLQKDL